MTDPQRPNLPEAEIDRLEQRLAQATPRPWIRGWDVTDVHWMGGNDALKSQADIDAAVSAVNAAPELIAEVRRLRQAVETEWYNGNVDEDARDRILDRP